MRRSVTASDPGVWMLTWKVLTVKRRGLTRDVPPGNEGLEWVANSSTLIRGERDAVLVDAFMTNDQTRTQIDWVAASGKPKALRSGG